MDRAYLKKVIINFPDEVFFQLICPQCRQEAQYWENARHQISYTGVMLDEDLSSDMSEAEVADSGDGEVYDEGAYCPKCKLDLAVPQEPDDLVEVEPGLFREED